MVITVAICHPPKTARGIPIDGLGSVHVSLNTNRWVRSKLALPLLWLGAFWSPSVSAFPVDVELISEPSVSNVLEKVYDARNSRPWLNRLVRLTSSALYQELPSDSMITSESGGTPGTGRSEEHTSELQSRRDIVCRLLL